MTMVEKFFRTVDERKFVFTLNLFFFYLFLIFRNRIFFQKGQINALKLNFFFLLQIDDSDNEFFTIANERKFILQKRNIFLMLKFLFVRKMIFFNVHLICYLNIFTESVKMCKIKNKKKFTRYCKLFFVERKK